MGLQRYHNKCACQGFHRLVDHGINAKVKNSGSELVSAVWRPRTENGCDHVLKFDLKKTTMSKICEYLRHHREHSVSEIVTPLPSNDLRDCGASRWDASFVNVDFETLFLGCLQPCNPKP